MSDYCYYIGIDMDDENAVISLFQTGMSEPETVSPIAGSEVFQIPLLMTKKRGIGQWFIGEDAKKNALLQNEEPVSGLLTKALKKEVIFVEGEKFEAEELLTLYLKKLILLASRLGNPGLPDFLVIAVESLTREMTDLFGTIVIELGIPREKLLMMDRKECFYYFTLNQKPELWLHDMFLFDYRGDEMKSCCMERNTKTVPQTITMTESVNKIDQTRRDEVFYKILMEQLQGHICSAIYLVGDGFEGDWMKNSLAYMCKGRRAFIGKNLYSKGACYAALVQEQKISWPYVYIGDNEMKVNVSLKVRNQGNLEFYTLISAGENWYETSGQCEVLLDDDKEVDFWLQLPNSREAKIEKLELADLPDRPGRTTRLRISAKPVSDTEVRIEIRDLGFGEIMKSSDQSWEYVMSL